MADIELIGVPFDGYGRHGNQARAARVLRDAGLTGRLLAGELADNPAGTGRSAIAELAGHVDRWWLHVDLDVLDPVEFPAQGLPAVEDQPGGLTWNQLTDLVMALFGSTAHCVGASIAIYDPDAEGAAQIVAFVRNALVRTTISP